MLTHHKNLRATIVSASLFVLALMTSACTVQEQSELHGDPANLAAGSTAAAVQGDDATELSVPCCSICPNVCNRYGIDSMQCDNCVNYCVDCAAAEAPKAAETAAETPAEEIQPLAPCCSNCPSVCSRYGAGSLQCESCNENCIDCAAAQTEKAAEEIQPLAPCCSNCPSVCSRYGAGSLQCESCNENCIDCAAATAGGCEPSASLAADKGDEAIQPLAPCCSNCPSVCSRYGAGSLQCESCNENCIDCF